LFFVAVFDLLVFRCFFWVKVLFSVCFHMGVHVGVVGLVAAAGLEGVLAKFSGRVAKLPVAYQTIFYADLETSIGNRLRILEHTAF
jgi:hypothetical protein